MDIRKMKIADLNRAEYNPRRDMSGKEKADLRESIKSNGYLEPIVVNVRGGDNVVISGHQRLTIMQDMKIEYADVSVVDLDKDRERELNIILNRVKGSWDSRKLADLLDSISNREHLGFSKSEIDEILKAASSRIDALFDEATKLHDLEKNCTCPHCGHQGNDRIFGAWHKRKADND